MSKLRIDILEKKEQVLLWINDSESKAEIARRLSCKIDTLNAYLKQMGIIYTGNKGAKGKKHDPKKKSILDMLNTSNLSSSFIRRRLIEEGVK